MAERWTLYGDPDCTVYSRGVVHVEPDQNDLPYCSTSIKFLIDIKATVRRLAQQPSSNFDDDEDDDSGMSVMAEDNWSVDEDDTTIELQYNDPYDMNMRSALSDTLSQLKVPFEAHGSLVDSIVSEAARECSSSTTCRNYGVRLAAEVDVYVVREMDGDGDGGGGGGGAFVPASKSAIEKLERTRVEGASTVCSICMEEMVVGSEATCMPCSHVYHNGCIVEWLNKSGICPLCRFSLPTEMDDEQ